VYNRVSVAGLTVAMHRMCVAERVSVVSIEKPTRSVPHLNGKRGILDDDVR
jgi:hypothetical protein